MTANGIADGFTSRFASAISESPLESWEACSVGRSGLPRPLRRPRSLYRRPGRSDARQPCVLPRVANALSCAVSRRVVGSPPVKILYLASAGTADPTRASIPLHIAANGSVDQGQECAVVLVGDGTELVSRDKAERLEGVGIPPTKELLQKLLDNQIPVYI